MAETRLHMEDESDERLTAILHRIAQWSSLKDAIEQRELQLTSLSPPRLPSRL